MRNVLDAAPSRELHGRALRVARLIRPGDLRARDVLDIGCGFGSFVLHALSYDARVTGLEVSEQALDTARRHVDGARFVVGSATALPFPDASFDTVTAWAVLEHVPAGEEPPMFSEIARVLRPGGVLYLSTPYAAWAAKLTDPAWPLGHRHYRKRTLLELAAGFEVTDLETFGGFDAFDIQYSNACNAGGPFSGPGNICADPKLVGGSNVHQTTASPTVDKGSDELFNAVGGERANEDYEGDPRPTDGDSDGHTVDMGADESPAGFIAQPPIVPPPPPQCSDGADNDGDGAIDSADPGCLAGPTDNNEGDETPRDLILCGQRAISLVRADLSGSKVVLSGIVATSVAGQKVQLSARYLGHTGQPQKLGSVTPGADGQFQARVKKPSKKLFNDARYRAQVGTAKSVELKLPQSLASSSLKQVAGGMLELRGQVDRALLGKRDAVVIKRILCGKYTTVGQARPNKKGAYVVRFPSPPSQGSALYRAETKVLARPGSKRYVKQFARAIGITF